MIVKRFYNSLRFYGALVSQLLLPLLFTILGLTVVAVTPVSQEDAPRTLQLSDSGLSPGNSSVFFAQFGGSLSMNLSVSLKSCLFFKV